MTLSLVVGLASTFALAPRPAPAQAPPSTPPAVYRPSSEPVVEAGQDPRADAAMAFHRDSLAPAVGVTPPPTVRIAYAAGDSALVEIATTAWSTRHPGRGGTELVVIRVRRSGHGDWRAEEVVTRMHLSLRRP